MRFQAQSSTANRGEKLSDVAAICRFNATTVEDDIRLGSDNSTQYGAQNCAEKSIRLSHSDPEIAEVVHLTSAVLVRCPLAVLPKCAVFADSFVMTVGKSEDVPAHLDWYT
jgi:hypothetical protein